MLRAPLLPYKVSTYVEEGLEIRILVGFEGDYRVYRDVLAAGIRILRPCSEVDATDLEALEEEVKRFEPQVLICSRPKPVDSGVRPIWVELPLDPTQPTKVSVGGRYFERTNPTLNDLLGIIDEVEQLI
ncbi:MAG: hypothetical protein M3305_13080 [Actinomycetota bacterium]|nr:hypothetical protein [Actinomycetota bacterium]